MVIGDKFFTFAYGGFKPKEVIEVEVIDIVISKGDKYYHIQRIDNIYDRWFLHEDNINSVVLREGV